MNEETLKCGSEHEVAEYVGGKFLAWKKSSFVSKSSIKGQTANYYTSASEKNRPAIQRKFGEIFGPALWPAKEVSVSLAQDGERKLQPAKKDFETRILVKTRHQERCRNVLLELIHWDETNAWQGYERIDSDDSGKKSDKARGEQFFAKLKALVDPLVNGVFDRQTLQTENYARGVRSLTGNANCGAGGIDAQFEYLLGLEARTSVVFKCDNKYIQNVTTLAGEMTTGTWGSGSVSAHLGKGGIHADAAVALAMGMELKVEGESIWSADDFGVRLAGEGKLLVGAELTALAKLKLTPSALEASIKAGAFVGVKAACSGTVELLYMDEVMAAVAGSAYVTLGVGATIEATISASLFGPTTLFFQADASKGIGTGFHVKTEVNFDRMGLAASNKFRQAMCLPSIMRGYSTDTLKQDHLNLHYLKKSIACLREVLSSDEEDIKSLQWKLNDGGSKFSLPTLKRRGYETV